MALCCAPAERLACMEDEPFEVCVAHDACPNRMCHIRWGHDYLPRLTGEGSACGDSPVEETQREDGNSRDDASARSGLTGAEKVRTGSGAYVPSPRPLRHRGARGGAPPSSSPQPDLMPWLPVVRIREHSQTLRCLSCGLPLPCAPGLSLAMPIRLRWWFAGRFPARSQSHTAHRPSSQRR